MNKPQRKDASITPVEPASKPDRVKVVLTHYYSSYRPGDLVEVSQKQAEVWLERQGCKLA